MCFRGCILMDPASRLVRTADSSTQRRRPRTFPGFPPGRSLLEINLPSVPPTLAP
ncbi:unnamed protein product [Symbiodinium natans]|uniref:Uncharacterized protein n=1 Tax=Symbiodinium natans TaxID=878477 RepID=A0A812R927_9DINO|nr:unnamed protein product [Symbiodinium natans]